jgi:lipid-binding SYLF domain-containing protein
MRAIAWVSIVAIAGALCLTGCSTAPKTVEGRADLDQSVRHTIDVARQTDPGIQGFIDKSAGYAVFPTVGKGAVVVGGAFGRGELIQGGKMIGYCTLTQAAVGASLGGQSYSELVFFETPTALDNFKSGDYTFAAQVSAVAIKSGASANAKYADGVAVFTLGEEGLMVEASVGGQKFSFQPVAVAQATPTQPAPTPQ